MGDKEIIDGMKAVAEMAGMLKESSFKLGAVVDLMIQSIEGDHAKYFEAIEKVSDMSEDDLIGMVIVAATVLARIKVKTAGTPAYGQIRDILDGKTPAQES